MTVHQNNLGLESPDKISSVQFAGNAGTLEAWENSPAGKAWIKEQDKKADDAAKKEAEAQEEVEVVTPAVFVEAAADLQPSGEAENASDDSDDAEELKGEALDAALEERGLPKSGTADEKRQRVAEYDANN